MKFFHKMLFIALAFFIVAFDVNLYMLISKSWELNLDREFERSMSEHNLIANNIYDNLNTLAAQGIEANEELIAQLTLLYAETYTETGLQLSLWKNHKRLYPALAEGELGQPPTETAALMTVEGSGIIKISKTMPAPYRDILLVYERDISPLYDMQDSLTRFALMSSLITAVCFCLCLYLAIWGLTKPLHALSAMTGKLAAGAYSERLDSKRKDEFGELAANFDQMAEAVQRHIGELEEYATEKQRFAENLAHEIRTPLTAIKGFAEFFVSAFASDEERAKAAAYIKSETARLSQLSDTLLVIADVGKDGFSPQPVQLKDLFAAVVEIKEPLLKKRQQKLLASVVPSDMSVSGNFDLLTVFLSNCIDNASHASQEGAEIELNAYLDGKRAVVEVADRGIGMTNEQATRAFEAFYRADSSRSRAHGGVGLGLALCKQIAKAHGAEIKLDSAPVKGTSIKIFLQLAVQNSV